jgi:uncharacterized membrane protein YjjP (DUF1212 family)
MHVATIELRRAFDRLSRKRRRSESLRRFAVGVAAMAVGGLLADHWRLSSQRSAPRL